MILYKFESIIINVISNYKKVIFLMELLLHLNVGVFYFINNIWYNICKIMRFVFIMGEYYGEINCILWT